MYLVYTDEAGTADNQEITVIASYVVAERDILSAHKVVEELFDEYVPDPYRQGFAFHAYKVWGDPTLRQDWPMESRKDLISAMAAVPRFLNGAITFAVQRRSSPRPPQLSAGFSKGTFDHFMAFSKMVGRANKYVQDWGSANSLAIVVAEDLPEKQHIIRKALSVAQVGLGTELPIDENHILLTAEERATGIITQTNAGKAQRVIDTVHFATRDQAVLLQVADACAFVFRRYLNAQSMGDVWIEAMLGYPLVWEDWQGPASNKTFRFHAGRHT